MVKEAKVPGMETLHCLLPDAAATLALGTEIGKAVSAQGGRDLLRTVMLYGEMGGGKTTLTRGLVSALQGGTLADVCSPSFTIINYYSTKPPVMHVDLYRCPPGACLPDELDEALDPSADRGPLVLLEWPEHLPGGILPPKRLDILLQACDSARQFSAVAHGKAARIVCAALATWLAQTHPDWLMPEQQ